MAKPGPRKGKGGAPCKLKKAANARGQKRLSFFCASSSSHNATKTIGGGVDVQQGENRTTTTTTSEGSVAPPRLLGRTRAGAITPSATITWTSSNNNQQKVRARSIAAARAEPTPPTAGTAMIQAAAAAAGSIAGNNTGTSSNTGAACLGTAAAVLTDNNTNVPAGLAEPSNNIAGNTTGDEPKQYWPTATTTWFAHVKEEFNNAISISQHSRSANGVPVVTGKYPVWALTTVKPQVDPVGSNRWSDGTLRVLTREDFCLPDLLFWVPELRFPEFYESGRPKCKWHGTCACVRIKGWTKEPRHCYDENGVTALWGKKYLCSKRHEQNEYPKYFRSYDAIVMKSSPTYIQSLWRQEGFKITHRAAVRWSVIDSMRATLSRGLGASGFHKSLIEKYKQRHFETSRKWRSYVDMRYTRPLFNKRMTEKVVFVPFFSVEYQGRVPTLAYLIRQVTEDIESRIPYYTLKQTMIDGESLAGDHSHKITKVIRVDKNRAYEAFYSLMNPHIQIVGFWFTNGTRLEEVQPHLERLMGRYESRGFVGPLRIDTDCCCGERAFWMENIRRSEIADNLMDFLDESDRTTRNLLTLPETCIPVYTKSSTIIGTEIGKICEFLENAETEDRIISCDCEWNIPSKKAHVIQIGLLDGRTWVFQVSSLARLPLPLKTLLEERSIQKVGNRINCDVKKLREWGVVMSPTIELGRWAKDRCISEVANPPLAFLVQKLFSCFLPKDESTDRRSNWNDRNGLSESQIRYAALDVYASIKVYEKLRTIMNPRTARALKNLDLKANLDVYIFNPRLKTCAASGKLEDGLIVKRKKDGVLCLKVKISQKTDTIYTPGSSVEEAASPHLVGNLTDNNSCVSTLGLLMMQKASSHATKTLRDTLEGEDGPCSISVFWPKNLVRAFQRQTVSSSEEEVTVSKKQEIVARTIENDDTVPFDDEDTTEETKDSDSVNADSISTNNIELHNLRKERIKNDILHIFLRFERALSKEHGAFPLFMTALRDALYIPNKNDVDWVRQCLSESGMADDTIEKKMRTEFDWCLRRIRRHVPSPKVLESRYRSVVAVYKDIKDGKTRQSFFGEKAKLVHKSTLRHIQRNCLSDVPGMSYYVQVGTDKLGIPLLKCSRGTSALEGFHQKLRQLVRGFANAPRYARALVFEFIFRWNMDLEVHARGLPKEYEYFYDGSALENEILLMEKWSKEFDCIVHPDWGRASHCFATGEEFGIPIPNLLTGASTDFDIGSKEDEILEMDAAAASEAYAEQNAGDDGDTHVSKSIEESLLIKKKAMPESVAWLCTYSGRNRPTKKVQGSEEWKYFEENYVHYQDSELGTTTDNYSFANWSTFAEKWCEKVHWEEKQGKQSSFTYKNAALLKDAWKQYTRRTNRSTTMLGHAGKAKELQKQLTVPLVSAARKTPPASMPYPVEVRKDQSQQAEVVNKIFRQQLEIQTLLIDTDPQASTATPKKRARKKKKKNPGAAKAHHRCRQCGQFFNIEPWKQLHQVPPADDGAGGVAETGDNNADRIENLMYTGGMKPHNFCQVDVKQYADKFPCLVGEMPRQVKRAREDNNESNNKL